MDELTDKLLGVIAPHICKSCGEQGASLCDRCIFDVLQHKYTKCAVCFHNINAKNFAKSGNLCPTCARVSQFTKIFIVGAREEILQRLVDDYKFNSEHGAAEPLAKLLAKTLPPVLPPDMTVVPITTVAKNVRSRGFDHMKLIAKKLARIQHLPLIPDLLLRTNNLAQHFLANPTERRTNAEKSFAINPRAEVPAKALLIDDIFTTGATVNATAKILRSAGVQDIWLAVVMRQPQKFLAK